MIGAAAPHEAYFGTPARLMPVAEAVVFHGPDRHLRPGDFRQGWLPEL